MLLLWHWSWKARNYNNIIVSKLNALYRHFSYFVTYWFINCGAGWWHNYTCIILCMIFLNCLPYIVKVCLFLWYTFNSIVAWINILVASTSLRARGCCFERNFLFLLLQSFLILQIPQWHLNLVSHLLFGRIIIMMITITRFITCAVSKVGLLSFQPFCGRNYIVIGTSSSACISKFHCYLN